LTTVVLMLLRRPISALLVNLENDLRQIVIPNWEAFLSCWALMKTKSALLCALIFLGGDRLAWKCWLSPRGGAKIAPWRRIREPKTYPPRSASWLALRLIPW